jgi:hypothetical protein
MYAQHSSAPVNKLLEAGADVLGVLLSEKCACFAPSICTSMSLCSDESMNLLLALVKSFKSFFVLNGGHISTVGKTETEFLARASDILWCTFVSVAEML